MNTGAAGAIHRVKFFAGMPAPTEQSSGFEAVIYLEIATWDRQILEAYSSRSAAFL